MKNFKFLLIASALFALSCSTNLSPEDVVTKVAALTIEASNVPASEELASEFEKAIEDAVSNYANLDPDDMYAMYRPLFPKSTAKYGAKVRALYGENRKELSEDMAGLLSLSLFYGSSIRDEYKDEDDSVIARCEVVNSVVLADGQTAVVKSIQYDADGGVIDDAHIDVLTLIGGAWKLDLFVESEERSEIMAEYEQIVSAQ